MGFFGRVRVFVWVLGVCWVGVLSGQIWVFDGGFLLCFGFYVTQVLRLSFPNALKEISSYVALLTDFSFTSMVWNCSL
jgi:hypothetical protein